MREPTHGLSQQDAEAGGSLTLETQERAGAAPTTTDGVNTIRGSGPASKTGRCTNVETSGRTPSRTIPAQTWWIWAGHAAKARQIVRTDALLGIQNAWMKGASGKVCGVPEAGCRGRAGHRPRQMDAW